MACRHASREAWKGWVGEWGLKSTFNLSRSYHQLQLVVHASLCGSRCGELIWHVLLGRKIYAQLFLDPKPPIQFHHRWAVGNPQDHYTDSEQPSRLLNSLVPSTKLRSANLLVFYVFGVTRSGIKPWPRYPLARLCGRSPGWPGLWTLALEWIDYRVEPVLKESVATLLADSGFWRQYKVVSGNSFSTVELCLVVTLELGHLAH